MTRPSGLLNRLGIEVVIPEGEACCGSLVHHMGREAQAHAQAKANIDAWTAEMDADGLDAIVINVSGCGTTVKDYGFMLRTDPAYADKAARISSVTKDICEYLATLQLARAGGRGGPDGRLSRRLFAPAWPENPRQPKELLSKMGFTVKDVPEGHLCCGSAGTYNIVHSRHCAQLAGS